MSNNKKFVIEANFIEDYFLRTPNKDMTESIDLCTDLYEMISPLILNFLGSEVF